MQIPNYTKYDYNHENKKVTKRSNNKEITITHVKSKNSYYCKLYDDNGNRKSITLKKIQALCGYMNIDLKLLNKNEYKSIPDYPNYKIDIYGNIYSFSQQNPQGIIVKQILSNNNGYMQVTLSKEGIRKKVEVHYLMGLSFFDDNYREKNLYIMHKDFNKLNNGLYNLKLGTARENNIVNRGYFE